MALLFFIRNRLGRNLSYYKEKNVTISDYSLLIKDLPKVDHAQKKIKKVFEEFFYSQVKIEEIIMIGDLELYYKLKHEKETLLVRKRRALKKRNADQQKLQQMDKKLK